MGRVGGVRGEQAKDESGIDRGALCLADSGSGPRRRKRGIRQFEAVNRVRGPDWATVRHDGRVNP